MATFLQPLLRQPDRAWTLVNAETGTPVAGRVTAAVDSASRNRGLLGDRLCRRCEDCRGTGNEDARGKAGPPEGIEEVVRTQHVGVERGSGIAPRLENVTDAGEVENAGGAGVSDRLSHRRAVEQIHLAPVRTVREAGGNVAACPCDHVVCGREMFHQVAAGKAGGARDENRPAHRFPYWVS